MMMGMMNMIPYRIATRMTAPLLKKGRLAAGKKYNTRIKLNLENFLICGANCGTCPSKPVGKEALFCATGKSESIVVQKGCNCLACPLLALCGANSMGYFCIYGVSNDAVRHPDDVQQGTIPKMNIGNSAYLQRFIQVNSNLFQQAVNKAEQHVLLENSQVKEVQLDFIDDKKISSNIYGRRDNGYLWPGKN